MTQLAVRSLVLEHLESEGLSASLLAEVQEALRQAPIKHEAHSALLSVLASHGWKPQNLAAADINSWTPEAPDGPSQYKAETMKLQASRIAGAASHHLDPVTRKSSTSFCTRGVPIALVVLFSLVFFPCIFYSEWYIDELFAAVRNADARGETPLRGVLSHDFWGNALWDGQWTHKSYRPLVILSYALQYSFNHDIIKPQALRAFNVALHSVNCILLYVIGRRRGAPRHWACLASCLFAVHPVHSENVIYIVGRADALATHCWLLALLAWPPSRCSNVIRFRSMLLRLSLVTLLAIVGGLCKESGFCVLFQLAIGEILSNRPFQRGAPLLASFFFVYAGRSWFTQGTSAGFSYVDTPVQYHENMAVRAFTYLYFHAKYAQLMVLPQSLSWDYSYDALPLLRETWRDVRFLNVLTTYLGIVALASCGLRWRSRQFLFGLTNVIVPFIPASNLFFCVGTTIGERLLYPCNAGAALAVSAFGGHLDPVVARRVPIKSRRRNNWKFVFGLLLLSFYLYGCIVRVYQWQSRDHLFGPDLESYPRSAKAQHQYATILHRLNRFEEARIHFETSLSIFSDNALSEYCIAQILIETGKPQEALVRLDHILAGHGLGFGAFNIYALYIDYGFTLMLLRRFEEAIPYLHQGLKMNEDVPHGLNALGYCHVNLGQSNEAVAAFEKGLHYELENPYILNNLGATYMMMGQVDKGGDLLAKAAMAEPGVPAFAHNMRLVQVMVQTKQWTQEQFALELFFNRGN